MPVRTFLFIAFCVCLSAFSCTSEDGSAGVTDSKGAAWYSSACGKCHGSDGRGAGTSFPPLAGSEWVASDEEQLIRIVLYGLQGEIEVDGETYRGFMLGFERKLGDEEIAMILTHVRSSFGNDFPPVETSTVRRVRSGPHSGGPTRADELVLGQ